MRFGAIDWKRMNQQANEILVRVLGIEIDVTRILGTYSVAIQQMVAIARALEIESARVLILDEPTSSLSAHETEQLFEVMRRLKGNQVGIVFITHFIDQVYRISDRVTVIRNGRLVGTYETASPGRMALIEKMIGRTITEFDEMSKIKATTGEHIGAEPIVTTRDFGLTGDVEPMDLKLFPGEVLGLAGLVGSGRSETAGLLFGLETPDSGTLQRRREEGHEVSRPTLRLRAAWCSPRKTERRQASWMISTVRENIILALQVGQGWFRFLSRQRQMEVAERYVEILGIATPSLDTPVKNLSGGNQQKVILARWLATNPQVLILDEPTRGIDVGTKAEIQKLVLSLAEEGKACIFISSELEEVMRCSHRIAVMSDRRKVGEFPGDAEEKALMQAMAGGEA